MELRGQDGQRLVAESLERAVVQVLMRRLHVRRQGPPVHGESVILGRDSHGPRAKVRDRMVGAAVAELQLEGLAAQGEPEQLMTQADPEDGFPAGESLDRADLRRKRRGIAWPVGEK